MSTRTQKPTKKRLHFTTVELVELETVLRTRIESCEDADLRYGTKNHEEDLAILLPLYKRIDDACTSMENAEQA